MRSRGEVVRLVYHLVPLADLFESAVLRSRASGPRELRFAKPVFCFVRWAVGGHTGVRCLSRPLLRAIYGPDAALACPVTRWT